MINIGSLVTALDLFRIDLIELGFTNFFKSEVLGLDSSGNYIVRDIFRWMQTGRTPEGKYIGQMVPCNYVPSFFEDVVLNKLPFPKSHFISHDWKKKQAA